MKWMRTLPFFLLFSLLLACKPGGKYELKNSFTNDTWDRFNKLLFEMPKELKPGSYDISLVLKHTDALECDEFTVYVILDTPSGEERMNEVPIKIRDNNKSYGTKEKDGYYTITQKLWEGINISDTGACTISVENLNPKYQTPGIHEVAVIMEKKSDSR